MILADYLTQQEPKRQPMGSVLIQGNEPQVKQLLIGKDGYTHVKLAWANFSAWYITGPVDGGVLRSAETRNYSVFKLIIPQ